MHLTTASIKVLLALGASGAIAAAGCGGASHTSYGASHAAPTVTHTASP